MKMHKTRMFLPPIPAYSPGDYDLYHSRLRFVSMPRASLNITGELETLLEPVYRAAGLLSLTKNVHAEQDRFIVPIHELQVHHVVVKFPEARILAADVTIPIEAQQSIRSVVLPQGSDKLAHARQCNTDRIHLKLAVGLKLTSAIRTISPASAYLGPRFSAQVVPHLTMNKDKLWVARELASAVSTHPDTEVAKHCAVIIREYFGDVEQERRIVCTGLVERHGPNRVPAVISAFGLDTEAKRISWLEE
jgi:siderophore synthetase component